MDDCADTAPPALPEKPAPGRGLRLALALVVIAGFLALTAFLFSRMDTDAFFRIWRSASIEYLLLALSLYFLLNFFRALRFQAMATTPIPIRRLYPITLYYNFLAQTLPFRTGELSYVVILRRHQKEMTSDGASALVGSKLFELLMVILGGGIGMLSLLPRLRGRVWALLVMLVAGVVLCVLAIRGSGAGCAWFARRLEGLAGHKFIGRWFAPGRRSLLLVLAAKLKLVGNHLNNLREQSCFARMLLFSLGTYASSVSFNLLLLRLAGVPGDFLPLVAVISLVMMAGGLPLSLAGFGVVEGSWAFGLATLLGLPHGEAIAIGFFLHGCQLLAGLLSGACGYVWQAILKGNPD